MPKCKDAVALLWRLTDPEKKHLQPHITSHKNFKRSTRLIDTQTQNQELDTRLIDTQTQNQKW